MELTVSVAFLFMPSVSKKDNLQEQNGNAKPAVHNLREDLPRT